MKHLRLTLLLIVASCTYFSTPQQKAERMAKAYLDTAIVDFNKYQLVSSVPIDTLRQGPDNDPRYKLLVAKIDSSRTVADSLMKANMVNKIPHYRMKLEEQIKKNSEGTNSLLHQSLQYMLNYHGKPNGWILEQTYRSKDSTDKALYIHVFKIDEGLTKVVEHQSRKKLE